MTVVYRIEGRRLVLCLVVARLQGRSLVVYERI